MSHIVSVRTRVRDEAAVRLACRRMQLAEPARGSAQLFSGQMNGLLIQLPHWLYPVVIDTELGTMHYDNYEGRWGEQRYLDQFLQLYAVEKARLEARQKGLTVSETQLQDGSIRLQIQGGS